MSSASAFQELLAWEWWIFLSVIQLKLQCSWPLVENQLCCLQPCPGVQNPSFSIAHSSNVWWVVVWPWWDGAGGEEGALHWSGRACGAWIEDTSVGSGPCHKSLGSFCLTQLVLVRSYSRPCGTKVSKGSSEKHHATCSGQHFQACGPISIIPCPWGCVSGHECHYVAGRCKPGCPAVPRGSAAPYSWGQCWPAGNVSRGSALQVCHFPSFGVQAVAKQLLHGQQ